MDSLFKQLKPYQTLNDLGINIQLAVELLFFSLLKGQHSRRNSAING